jgi:imidazolonepropionase-like amidohydrolase
MRTAITSIVLTCLTAVVANAQARPLGITHVTVIDVEHGRRLRDHTVIIEGARISTVGPSDQVRVPDGYGVVDARGKFVIPGLIDLHAHLTRDAQALLPPDSIARALARLALSGVTTVVELSPGIDSITADRTPRGAPDVPVARVRVVADFERSRLVDPANSGQSAAESIHDELRRAVADGLTSAAALRTVTFDAARALRWEGRIGSVAPSRMADLLVLDANPLDDISNTTRIAAIVVGGRFVDAAERNRLLAQLGVR